MLSAATIKHIRSLELKKFRSQHGSFVAEGDKIVRELLLSDLQLLQVFALEPWIESNGNLISSNNIRVNPVSPRELERISLLKTPNQVLAVVKIPEHKPDPADLKQNLTLALDNLQDPGNLGTIIRTADWFGLRNIYCSSDTADVYNPKVIQATMGSFMRVRLHYVDLEDFLGSLPHDLPVYGAFLQGQNVFQSAAALPAVLVIGNESQGIGARTSRHVSHRLSIPSAGSSGAESLNAAVAAAILMARLKNS